MIWMINIVDYIKNNPEKRMTVRGEKQEQKIK